MPRPIRMIVAPAVIALVSGCTAWHQNATPVEGVSRAKSGEIRVNRVDGSTVRLVNASIVADSVIGVSPVTGARIAIPTSAIMSTETKDVSGGRTALLGGGILLGVAAVTGILLIVALLSLGGSF